MAWVVSQTRVCDAGSQFTSSSLRGCGSQRNSAITISWTGAIPETYGYVRPSRPSRPQSLRAVGRRPGNPTPAVDGRRRGAFSHLSGRRRLRDQYQTRLALSGPLAASRRHLGCDVHLTPDQCGFRVGKGRTARNRGLPTGCAEIRRPRSSRWWPVASARSASPGPSAYRLRQSVGPKSLSRPMYHVPGR